MNSKIEIVKKTQYNTSKWSGGITTELLIYPSDSKYSERSFKWRISCAKVETSESEFTYLPNITRHIMITDGSVILDHQNKYKMRLKPFDQDMFMGDWKTKSYGMATDFNLMLNDGFNGKLITYLLEELDQVDIDLNEGIEGTGKQVTNVFYVLNGTSRFVFKKQEFNVSQNDLIYITGLITKDSSVIKISSSVHSSLRVIRTVIWE